MASSDIHSDGLRFRVASPQDCYLLQALFETASPESLYTRFLHVVKSVSTSDILDMIGDGGTRAVTVLCSDGQDILGAATYQVQQGGTAEVSLLVTDIAQGRGIGKRLLHRLVEVARTHALHSLTADVLNGNRAMLALLQHAHYKSQCKRSFDISHFQLFLSNQGPKAS